MKWTLLHDCENCAIPSSLNGISLYSALSSFLFRAFPVAASGPGAEGVAVPSLDWLLFTTDGLSGLGSPSTVIQLQMKGCLVIFSGSKKGSVDVAIKAQCNAFRRRNNDLPADLRRRRPVAIISGDRDFAHEVNELRGDGFPVVIVHGEAVTPGFRQIVESPGMAIRWEQVKALASSMAAEAARGAPQDRPAGGARQRPRRTPSPPPAKRRRVDADGDQSKEEYERQLQEALEASLKESRSKPPPPPPLASRPSESSDDFDLAFFDEGDVVKLGELGFPRERAVLALTHFGNLSAAAIALSMGQF